MESKLYNRVSSADLFERLDSEYYSSDLMHNEQKMSAFKQVTLESIVDSSVPNNISDLTSNGSFEFLRGIEFNSTGGIPYIRTQNLMDNYLSDDGYLYVSSTSSEKVKKSLCNSGDLIVCRKGKVGSASSVPDRLQGAAISENVTRFSLDDTKDADFISVFLNSYHGRKRFLREATGVIQKWINNEKLREIKVIEIDHLAQKYIGNKVRQAECLRAWAKQIEIDTHEVFNASIAWDKSVLDVKNYGYVKLAELDGRLDLKYNSPERLAVLRHLKKQRIETSPLSSICSISAMIGWKGLTTEFYRESGPWLLRGVEFKKGVIDTEGLVCVDEFKYNEQPQIHLKEGDLAFSKDGTIGKAIVIPKLRNRLAAGSTIARLRMKGSTNPYYLEFVLSHSIVQAQIESFATGIAQPHITQEWIAKLEIPKVDCEEKIAEYWNTHHLALNSAKSLTKLANLLVEDLIDGQLIESQLVAAQQALETGDDSLDRDLLERMTTEGIDADSDPMFDDIDQLYDLLEQANQSLDAGNSMAEV